MENKKETQTERVLKYMEQHGSITSLQAISLLGVMRLASRISDLRKAGFPIESEMVTATNRFGEKVSVKRYKLRGGAENAVD